MMSSNISVYFATNVGNSRQNQEDNAILPNGFYVSQQLRQSISDDHQTYEQFFIEKIEEGFLAAVSDGMGGHESGEVASMHCIRFFSENRNRIISYGELSKQSISNEISELNRRVVSFSKHEVGLRGMGATLCGIVYKNNSCFGFNVGDSRLYRFSDNALRQLSTDHTEGQRMLSLNLLTEEELHNFTRRKNLYKYIGIDCELIPDVFRIDNCASGNMLLICSDGLTDVLSDCEIENVLKMSGSVQQKGRFMVSEAIKRNIGFGDNITMILIEF